jgi:hypothetical protein
MRQCPKYREKAQAHLQLNLATKRMVKMFPPSFVERDHPLPMREDKDGVAIPPERPLRVEDVMAELNQSLEIQGMQLQGKVPVASD